MVRIASAPLGHGFTGTPFPETPACLAAHGEAPPRYRRPAKAGARPRQPPDDPAALSRSKRLSRCAWGSNRLRRSKPLSPFASASDRVRAGAGGPAPRPPGVFLGPGRHDVCAHGTWLALRVDHAAARDAPCPPRTTKARRQLEAACHLPRHCSLVTPAADTPHATCGSPDLGRASSAEEGADKDQGRGKRTGRGPFQFVHRRWAVGPAEFGRLSAPLRRGCSRSSPRRAGAGPLGGRIAGQDLPASGLMNGGRRSCCAAGRW